MKIDLANTGPTFKVVTEKTVNKAIALKLNIFKELFLVTSLLQTMSLKLDIINSSFNNKNINS